MICFCHEFLGRCDRQKLILHHVCSHGFWIPRCFHIGVFYLHLHYSMVYLNGSTYVST